jgi:hypothetical protein
MRPEKRSQIKERHAVGAGLLTVAGHGNDREPRLAQARAEARGRAVHRSAPGDEAGAGGGRRHEGALAKEEARGGGGGDDGGRAARSRRGGSHGRLSGHRDGEAVACLVCLSSSLSPRARSHQASLPAP